MQNNKAIHSAVAGILALGAAAASTFALAVPGQPKTGGNVQALPKQE